MTSDARLRVAPPRLRAERALKSAAVLTNKPRGGVELREFSTTLWLGGTESETRFQTNLRKTGFVIRLK